MKKYCLLEKNRKLCYTKRTVPKAGGEISPVWQTAGTISGGQPKSQTKGTEDKKVIAKE